MVEFSLEFDYLEWHNPGLACRGQGDPMRAFLCHSSRDSAFVIGVAAHLRRHLDGGVFYFEDYQRADDDFQTTIGQELRACEVFVVFVGPPDREAGSGGQGSLTSWQVAEAQATYRARLHDHKRQILIVRLADGAGRHASLPQDITLLGGFPCIDPPSTDAAGAIHAAAQIVRLLQLPWRGDDGLPLNPHVFSYEKDIIDFYSDLHRFGHDVLSDGPSGDRPDGTTWDVFTKRPESVEERKRFDEIREKLLGGCPSRWPRVARFGNALGPGLPQEIVGTWGKDYQHARTTVLTREDATNSPQLLLPEARPRQFLHFPQPGHRGLKAAVLVSGGIAPGINAVIDAITQRHWLYAGRHGYANALTVYGFQNGFRGPGGFANGHRLLAADPTQYRGEAHRLETSHYVNRGGSILGTSRVDALIDPARRHRALRALDMQLDQLDIDILYIIGGDGSMKAAHALWNVTQTRRRLAMTDPNRRQRPLSVVAIPKTMDNDVLWVWQSFGFLSAVEKARETIEHLHTEVTSNPRLCVMQLFGSDSGYVVSHAVLASGTGHCCLALIPEVEFTIQGIANYLARHLCLTAPPIPHGLIAMAETAIPLDAHRYTGSPGEVPEIDIDLTEDEKREIRRFVAMRDRGERIQGQTNDDLRTGGLRIVCRGLQKALPGIAVGYQPEWKKIVTNEPRHLLRAVPPSVSDIIIGNRLGTLAVDNALAGYTDFMISQWLTEYVLVPLELVVLGRKRIPTTGIFWKSVLAKTGQPSDLTEVAPPAVAL
jgi:6-phosphofructokinase 1